MAPVGRVAWRCQLWWAGPVRRLSTRAHAPGDVTAAAAVVPAEEIEIERKFLLDERTADRLAALPHAAPAAVSQFTDAYFDTAAFALTRHDHWLRQRNAAWELKWPLAASSYATSMALRPLSGIDYYTESRDWPSIAAALARLGILLAPPFPTNPPTAGPMATTYLLRHGLACFATLHTTRTRLAPVLQLAGGFRVHVDLDVVTYVDAGADAAPYRVGEVELVHAADPAASGGLGGCTPADALADAFAQLGISPAPVRGKVLEYLARFRPTHYAALAASGLIASKLGDPEVRT